MLCWYAFNSGKPSSGKRHPLQFQSLCQSKTSIVIPILVPEGVTSCPVFSNAEMYPIVIVARLDACTSCLPQRAVVWTAVCISHSHCSANNSTESRLHQSAPRPFVGQFCGQVLTALLLLNLIGTMGCTWFPRPSNSLTRKSCDSACYNSSGALGNRLFPSQRRKLEPRIVRQPNRPVRQKLEPRIVSQLDRPMRQKLEPRIVSQNRPVRHQCAFSTATGH